MCRVCAGGMHRWHTLNTRTAVSTHWYTVATCPHLLLHNCTKHTHSTHVYTHTQACTHIHMYTHNTCPIKGCTCAINTLCVGVCVGLHELSPKVQLSPQQPDLGQLHKPVGNRQQKVHCPCSDVHRVGNYVNHWQFGKCAPFFQSIDS